VRQSASTRPHGGPHGGGLTGGASRGKPVAWVADRVYSSGQLVSSALNSLNKSVSQRIVAGVRVAARCASELDFLSQSLFGGIQLTGPCQGDVRALERERSHARPRPAPSSPPDCPPYSRRGPRGALELRQNRRPSPRLSARDTRRWPDLGCLRFDKTGQTPSGRSGRPADAIRARRTGRSCTGRPRSSGTARSPGRSNASRSQTCRFETVVGSAGIPVQTAATPAAEGLWHEADDCRPLGSSDVGAGARQ
jgi:hypothetical protein